MQDDITKQFKPLFDKHINDYAQTNQYGVSMIPSHTHNGTDMSHVDPSNFVSLESDTTTINVSRATAPTANQALIATGPTSATWQTISTSILTGVLPVANGGTGATTILGANIPQVRGTDRKVATSSAETLAAYTVGAADGIFLVSANVNVTTSTTHNFTVTCTYTDETNTSRTLTLGFTQLAGAALISNITNVTGAGPYEGISYHIRAKAGTTITIASVGTFTVVQYNFEELITQYK